MFATSLVLINSTFISRWKGFLQLAHRNNDCFQTPQDVIGDLGPHGMCCVLFVTEDNTHTSTPITYAGVKPYKEHSRPEGDANHSDDNPHGTRFMTGDYPAWSFKMTQNTQDEALQVTAVLKSNHLSTGSGVRDQKVKTTHACPKKSPLGSRIPGSSEDIIFEDKNKKNNSNSTSSLPIFCLYYLYSFNQSKFISKALFALVATATFIIATNGPSDCTLGSTCGTCSGDKCVIVGSTYDCREGTSCSSQKGARCAGDDEFAGPAYCPKK